LGDLDLVTKELYAKHSEYFTEDEIILLDSDSLIVMKNGKELIFESNSNVMQIDGRIKNLPSIIICVDGVYYLPEAMKSHL
jgi:hypothetical protein